MPPAEAPDAWQEALPTGPWGPGGCVGPTFLQTVVKHRQTERKRSRLLVPKDLEFGEMRDGQEGVSISGHFRFVE